MSDKMREAHWREWGIDGMPKDKQRLADAAWQAGYVAALAQAEQRSGVGLMQLLGDFGG